MEQYHGPSRTKTNRTGARRKRNTDKRLYHKGGAEINTKVIEEGDETRKIVRTKGGNQKIKIKRAKFANVTLKDGKKQKASITNVAETSSNRHYARKNIVTKGAIIDTEVGKVRVTNRVGQDGIINGVQV